MRITKAVLESTTQVIEDVLKEQGKHPGGDWKLILDYAACYGGYCMIYAADNGYGRQAHFGLMMERVSAEKLNLYQQGILYALNVAV